ncbi:DNA-directed RNA polymerase II subunit RPB1, partial [Biomphalaria pfeifferi]
VAVAVIAAQTRSEYTRFYQPVPSQPSNAYNPSYSQPAGYSRPQPNKYAPGQPYIYTPSSQPYGFNQPANNPSYPTGGYNNAPVYQPQASNYGPYSPVNLFIGGPASYGPYNAYPANSYQNCTDQTCKNTECCEFNGLRYVCVAQSSAVTTAAPGGKHLSPMFSSFSYLSLGERSVPFCVEELWR